MKIAIMGAGALGCYFGGRLVQAGYDVAFIARGAHLEALKKDGLRIESALGDAHLPTVTATDDPAEVGPVDLVMFLVKLYDTDSAARQMTPLIGPETAVVSFQNGVDGWDRIAAVIGRDRVIGGVARIPADIRAPGVVRHNGAFAKLEFGEFDGRVTPRIEALRSALETAGVEVQLAEDIEAQIWEKFVFLSTLSGMTALTRLSIGPIRDDAECFSLYRAAVEETAAVGLAKCAGLPKDVAARVLEFSRSLPPHMRASMLDDLERGKRIELMHLSGAVAGFGAELGIATPVHAMIVQALHPYVNGAPDKN